jgi:hypothetical protein
MRGVADASSSAGMERCDTARGVDGETRSLFERAKQN